MSVTKLTGCRLCKNANNYFISMILFSSTPLGCNVCPYLPWEECRPCQMMIRVWSGTEKSGLSTLTNIPSEIFNLIFIKTRNKNIQEIYSLLSCYLYDFYSFLKRKVIKSVDWTDEEDKILFFNQIKSKDWYWRGILRYHFSRYIHVLTFYWHKLTWILIICGHL